ncbi:MAG: SLBB domain-containing protein [Waddliaceae bacterium]
MNVHFILLTFFLFFLSSCTKPCCDYNIVGPDEFVTDSYCIRQGKLAIKEMMGEYAGAISCDALEEYEDCIVEDDILNIALYHPTRKEIREAFEYINHSVGGFRVTEGRVDLPDIQSVEVMGLTLREAQEKLKMEIQKHYCDAEIFISYKDRLQRKVELAGSVKTPAIPVDGKIRLYEVLTKAGILPNANLFMSYVMREGYPLPLDLYKLINEGDMNQNIVMRGGDKIFIANPSDAVVMVMGEVNSPTAIEVPYGFITLPEALVRARGIPYTGNRRCIQVIRGDIECPKIYVISWEHIVNLPNRSMLLIPGDTVYVSEKPITKWNRFISQLLPTASCIREVHGTYNLFY